MPTMLLTGDDTRFLAQQPEYEVNTMLGQMTTLMQNITSLQSDTYDKVAQLENQNWFKRMTNTLFGKNKATKQEIQKNNDKVVTYISQSVAQLYNLNLINERVISSLGNRMNEVYAQVVESNQEILNMKGQISQIMAVQQQTLEAMGAFVNKLNEKIESVDNFHMLISEIQNGMYNDSSKLYNICSILSQLDKRQMDDSRKMNLLNDTMIKSNIITQDEFSVLQCLQEIVALPQEKVGLIYLELCNFRSSFPANMFADMIENYHFLSKMEKMSKKKETLIQNVIDKYGLDADAAFSIADISESFFENKQASFVCLDNVQVAIEQTSENVSSVNQNTEQVQPVNNNSNGFDMNKFESMYNQNAKSAYEYAREFAGKQVAEAQFAIGKCLYNGQGVKQDRGSAKFYFTRSAEQGYENAAEFLNKTNNWKNDNPNNTYSSNNQYNSNSNNVSTVKSSNTLISMANSGDYDAIVDLALAYYWGENDKDYGIKGIKENEREASKWLEKAANLGDRYCQYLFGMNCYHGTGVSKNYQRAMKWLKKAAEQGHGWACFQLYIMYFNSLGCSEDKDIGMDYYYKACDILNDGDEICPNCGSNDYNLENISTGRGKGAAVGAAAGAVFGLIGAAAGAAAGALINSSTITQCTCKNCNYQWEKIFE